MPSLSYRTTVPLHSRNWLVDDLSTAVCEFITESDHYESWSVVEDTSIRAPLARPENDFIQSCFIEVTLLQTDEGPEVDIVGHLTSGASTIPEDERDRVHQSVDSLTSELREHTSRPTQ